MEYSEDIAGIWYRSSEENDLAADQVAHPYNAQEGDIFAVDIERDLGAINFDDITIPLIIPEELDKYLEYIVNVFRFRKIEEEDNEILYHRSRYVFFKTKFCEHPFSFTAYNGVVSFEFLGASPIEGKAAVLFSINVLGPQLIRLVGDNDETKIELEQQLIRDYYQQALDDNRKRWTCRRPKQINL